MPEPTRRPSQTLMYARGVPDDARVSWLAIASLPVAVLASPCVLSQVRGLNQVWAFLVVGMVIAIALPIVALIRIHRSRGTRTGIAWAVVALLISVVGWGGLLLLTVGMGPYWHG